MASIRERNGKWQVQIRRADSRPLSRTFIQKSDAVRWARHSEVQIDRNFLGADKRELSKVTVGDILKRYRDTVSVGKKGAKIEKYVLNKFLRYTIAKSKLIHASPDKFAQLRDELLSELSPATVSRQLTLIQHSFEVARREWGFPLEPNPVAQIRKPQFDNRRERRLEKGELRALMVACRRSRNAYIAPMIILAIETGMRRGELLRVRQEHLDTNASILHIPEAKNGFSRTIPLSKPARNIFSMHAKKTGDTVFPISANALKLAWCRLIKRTKITDLRFHDLRHEAISRLFEKGLSLPEVALISGHRDYRMLQRYTHLRPEDVLKKL